MTTSTALNVEIDTTAPNTPLLGLLQSNDSGNLGDGLTNDNTPLVSMTTHDAGTGEHLLEDNFKFRIYDRYENAREYLLYDSALDEALDFVSIPDDGFTSTLFHTELLPTDPSLVSGRVIGAITNSGALADGVHHLKLEVEDRAGNISEDFLFDLTIDTVVPTTTVDLIDFSDTGMFFADNVTNINQPAFTGVSEVDAHVILFAQRRDSSGNTVGDRFQVGTGRVGSNSTNSAEGQGVWEITSEPLADGVYQISAQVEDWAGNLTVTQPFEIEIDTVAPNTPLLNLLAADDQGHLNDGRTNDSTPSVSMTTHDAGNTTHLFTDNFKFRIYDRYENSQEFLLYDSVMDDALDAMSFDGDDFTSVLAHIQQLPDLSSQSIALGQALGAITATNQLADGVHHLKLEVEDRAGNISEDFLYNLTIDTVVPATTIDLIDSSDSGMFADDNVTNISSPAFSGVGEVDAHVTLYAYEVNGNGERIGTRFPIGESTVGSDATNDDPNNDNDNANSNDGLGVWEITSEPLDNGLFEVHAQIEDWSGNLSFTDPITVEIDSLQPNTPRLALLVANDTGHANDGLTSVNTPAISMTTQDAGSHDRLFNDNLKYRIYDRFDNQREFLLYDSTTDGTLDGISVSGDMFTSAISNIEQIPSGDAIAIGQAFGAITDDGALADGVHNLKLEVEDRAGNISEDYLFDLTIDSVLLGTADFDLVSGSDTGMHKDDRVTRINAPALSGISEVDAMVTLFAQRVDEDGNPLSERFEVGAGQVGSDKSDGTPANGLGLWEITSEPLDDGLYDMTVLIEDWAGNTLSTADGQVITIEIDTIQPNTPLLALFDSSDTGHQDDGRTADNRPLVSMTTHDAGEGLHLFADNLKFRIWDRFENQEEFLIYDSSTDGVLDGISVSGDMFTSALANAEQLPNAAAVAIGQTFGAITQDGALADGTHNFKLEVEDRAGNISEDFLLQLIVDASPLVGSTAELISISDSGMSDSDNVTNINTPTFAGVAEVDVHVTLFAQQIDNAGNPVSARFPVGTAVTGSDDSNDDPSITTDDANANDGLGVWEIESEALHDGIFQFSVLFEDWNGNREDITTDLVVEIDTLAPNLPHLDLLESSDSGRSNSDNVTNDATPTFSMTTEDRTANPMVYDHLVDDNLKYRVYVRPEGDLGLAEVLVYDSAIDGALTLTDGLTTEAILQRTLPASGVLAGQELPDGVHNFKLELEDRAGNISTDWVMDVVIDRVAPDGTGDIDGINDSGIWGYPETLTDGITANPTPSFSGTAEANTIVSLSVDGVPVGTTVAVPLDGNDAFDPPNPPYEGIAGNWTIETGIVLSDGAHTASITFEDLAGNRSPDGAIDTRIFIDSQGPRIANVTRNDADFTSLFELKPDGGPDPLISSIVLHFTDGPDRPADFQYEAVFRAIAEEEGHYSVVGDANGNIPIVDVNVIFEDEGPGQAVSRVELVFDQPLPDDRFTLHVSDVISDRAGNALDGESGAEAPFVGNDGTQATDPIFPTGDGVHGGSFEARFTIDSRPEIGSWAAGSVWVDTNGNFTFDPFNQDYVIRDITYKLGFTSDDIFAGNFVAGANDTADGYDKLAAWGYHDGHHRWLIDVDNDGVPDIDSVDPNSYGKPVAGDFDGNPANGDEVSALHNGWWYFDTDHDFKTDLTLATNLVGHPIVGDFDGNGFDDLATWSDDVFQIDLDGGRAAGWDGVADRTFRFGFIGVRERPVAADMDQDGFDDIGLWVPDREGVTPGEAAEWYWLISGGESLLDRIVTATDPVHGNHRTIEYTPRPFGQDFFAQFGDEFALPIVGNFDPPVLPASPIDNDGGNEDSGSDDGGDNVVDWHNERNPLDVNDDGAVLPLDVLMVVNGLNDKIELEGISDGPYLDVSGDGLLTAFDALLIVNHLNDQAVANGEPAPILVDDVDAVWSDDEAESKSAPVWVVDDYQYGPANRDRFEPIRSTIDDDLEDIASDVASIAEQTPVRGLGIRGFDEDA